jgi:RNA recognition motif-containing protein
MSKKRKISSTENDEQEEEEATSSIDESESVDKVVTVSETKKKPIPGVIFLSRIPNKMNVTIIRTYFDQYGHTGRIYLQLSSKLIVFTD